MIKSTFKLITNVGAMESVRTSKDINGLFDDFAPLVDGRTLRKGKPAQPKFTEKQLQTRQAWRSCQKALDKVRKPTYDESKVVVLTHRIDEHTVAYMAKSEDGPQWKDLSESLADAVLFYSQDDLNNFVQKNTDMLTGIELEGHASIWLRSPKGVESVYIIKEKKGESDQDTENTEDTADETNE